MVRVARKRPWADDQALRLRDRQTDLDPELAGLSGLALRDTFHFRRVQRVERALILGPLTADAPGSLNPDAQLVLSLTRGVRQFTLDVAQQPSQHGALAFEHPSQALELFGVHI